MPCTTCQDTMPYTPLAKSVLHRTHTQRQLALTKRELVRVKQRLRLAEQEVDELSAELVRTRMLLDSLRMMS